jgi:sterol desaturase/sphingolipid hydroxylase (fatty acid hydroxylase superfamily)
LLLRYAPHGRPLQSMAPVLVGVFTWTFIEYCVHRFVLHGVRPWRYWHAQHHRHPQAHIFAPTLIMSALFAALVFAPALWLGGLWVACGFTAGVLCGYLVYSLTHLAIHHRTARGRWLRQRQIWHTEHHRQADRPDRYGVTTQLWDRLFAMTGKPGRQSETR